MIDDSNCHLFARATGDCSDNTHLWWKRFIPPKSTYLHFKSADLNGPGTRHFISDESWPVQHWIV